MPLAVSEIINAPREKVWNIIADIDSAQSIVQSIIELEVLERPDTGILGLKWREKRVMFGKEATETMWISSAEPGYWYETTAHNHGMIYHSRMSLTEQGSQTVLTMSFDCVPQTWVAKLFGLMSFMFNGAVRKAFAADIRDIKAYAES